MVDSFIKKITLSWLNTITIPRSRGHYKFLRKKSFQIMQKGIILCSESDKHGIEKSKYESCYWIQVDYDVYYNNKAVL